MIYKHKPHNFNPQFEVVSCFIEAGGKILVLHRQNHKPEGNTWGVPAGKVDPKETISPAMIREIREETGINIALSKLRYFGKMYVQYPTSDFVYHTFSTSITLPQEVTLNPTEHKDFRWVSPQEALDLPLVRDMDLCIKLFYNVKRNK